VEESGLFQILSQNAIRNIKGMYDKPPNSNMGEIGTGYLQNRSLLGYLQTRLMR